MLLSCSVVCLQQTVVRVIELPRRAGSDKLIKKIKFMKNLSVKNLKKATRKLYSFKAGRNLSGGMDTTTTDPTTTTITTLTSHLK
jgi:hypothetical protein